MRRCAPNFCQELGEASELTTNAQRVASALHVYRAHTERIQGAHVKKSNECTACCYRTKRIVRACTTHSTHSQQTAVRLVLHAATPSEVVLVDTISRNLHHHPWGSEKWWWYPMATRLEHARRMLGALVQHAHIRCMFRAGHALEAR